MLKKLFYAIIFLVFAQQAAAQDTLPKISVTQLGKKVLVSWTNPFQTVTAINIQRSGDSVKNFTTIGSVLNVGAVSNGFVDTKEFIPNDQYYRLFIAFEGGSYIFTDAHQAGPDTMNVKPEVVETAKKNEIGVATTKEVQTWFVPSTHVYTGKDNNVVISLPDAKENKYSLKIFEDDGTFLFEVNKIPSNLLYLDKANFLHSGLFRFELYKNKNLIERHKLYIPKEGKSIPPLDVNGYEIRK